jgi:hypothetical protein
MKTDLEVALLAYERASYAPVKGIRLPVAEDEHDESSGHLSI